jgi:hypothetical protein
MSSSDIDSRIERLRTRLAALNRERREIAARIDELQRAGAGQEHRVVAIAETVPLPPPGITAASPAVEKLTLFKSLFRGWIRGLCHKPRSKCGDCLHQAFIPVGDTIMLRKPMSGVMSIGSPVWCCPIRAIAMVWPLRSKREPRRS